MPRFFASYHEQWDEISPNRFCLNRAYLTIFQFHLVGSLETEYLCLHCDPNEPDGPHRTYKQGPHFHIKGGSPDPIPHAHIALNRLHLKEVLSSISSISHALEAAITMLKEQILEPLRDR